ncbi:MAG: glutaredoxin [Bacteroidetes bacterium]|nr:MAG: glutaredoxin [Bacteroidota bacterium]
MQLVSSDWVLFYNSQDPLGKKTRAYAESSSHKLNTQDLSFANLSSTTLRVILDSLGLSAKDLMNKAHPFYQSQLRGKEYDEEGWLNVLKKNSFLIKYPIVFKKGRVYLCSTPNDIFKNLN